MLKPLQKSTSQKPCCRFAPRRFCFACFFSAASTIFRYAFQLVFYFLSRCEKLCPQSVLSLCSKTVLLRLLFLRGFNHFPLCFSTCFLFFKPLQKKTLPTIRVVALLQDVFASFAFSPWLQPFCSLFFNLLFIFLTFRLPDMLSRLNPAMCERRNIQVSSQVFLLRKRKLQLVLPDLQDGALQSQQEFLFR